MSFIKQSATVCAFATLAMSYIEAGAATARLTCEARPNRSKISLDARSLAASSRTTSAVSVGNRAARKPEAHVVVAH